MSKRLVSSAIWNLEGVGKIRIYRNLQAKRLTISIRPSTGIRVTVPGLLPFRVAQDFVNTKKDWITHKVQEIETKKSTFNNDTTFCTRYHKLRFSPHQSKKLIVEVSNTEIIVKYPEQLTISDSLVQNTARNGIIMAYRKEAKQILPERIAMLAKQKGFSYNTLSIKNIKSRWGSCSAKNNINLSIYLMKLPDELIDYVILHELTHTIHKNHGKDFWNHLDKITSGNSKELAARIKKYQTGI
ncbi:MAG TPA: SprT family zinc-dependent metalloprotease [Tenuifilaceae bacterium]|nr:SprT family zinc-dependent metalloprotease [Tenuifilaceae bacterium]HPE17150.1 SprT family zinc-dependent metalloprotease [Tenuifilaceae bacterium]HPJ45878.1 SprT family zinc-dependent metalloprotease [Tenuifilaceae bacterium]HPQ34091.1 SprT family zinc-dependent metalloprotease [Tenuifilaceae bacterium]